MRVKDKIAIVTASTKGIGLECVKVLAKNGAKVYMAARNKELAQSLLTGIKGNVEFIYFNAREVNTYKDMIDEVMDKEGRIDILVNNYGSTNVEKDKDLINTCKDDFFDVVIDNLQSVFIPTKELVSNMKGKGTCSIVNVSSIGGSVADTSRIAYTTSKAGINSLTKNIAVQYAKDGIRCNAVLPGLIATDAAINNMSEEFISEFLNHVPLNRFGAPEDIANVVLFLASDESSFITGELIEIAGGFGKASPTYKNIQIQTN